VLNYIQSGTQARMERRWDDPAAAPGESDARLHYIGLKPLGSNTDQITVQTALQLEAAFWNYQPDAVLNLSIVIYNIEGVPIFNTGSGARPFPVGLVRGSFVIPGDFLNDDTYTVRVLIVKDTSVILLDLSEVLMFEVQDSDRDGNWYGKWIGTVRPKFDWRVSVDETVGVQDLHDLT
jgi:lipopolysaccharide transport system ATP-binding protein